MSFKRRVLLTLAVGAIAALPSFAATIDLGINGDALVGPDFIYFSSNYPINTAFAPAPSSPTTVTPANYGLVQVAQVSGSLPGVTSGETANFQSLSMAVDPIRPPGFDNPYTPGSPFLTFNGGGSNQQFYLTALLAGTFDATPFSFINSPNGLIVYFNVDGYVLNTTTNARTNYTGTFSATFNSVTDITTLAGLLPLQTPFSATFTLTAVPEPGSLLLMGFGLLGAGLIARRRMRT